MNNEYISSFSGPWSGLSNFYVHPFRIDGINDWWNSAEHAYQAAKAMSPADYRAIRDAPTPAQAKQLGRRTELPPWWNDQRKKIMLRVLLAKYEIPELARLLYETKTAELVEGNTWGDWYWGAVPSGSQRRRIAEVMPVWGPEGEWAGHNWLGRLLMMVRDVQSVQGD